jgi:hypothetical protein
MKLIVGFKKSNKNSVLKLLTWKMRMKDKIMVGYFKPK